MKATKIKKIGVKEAIEKRIVKTLKHLHNGKYWVYGSEVENTMQGGKVQITVDSEVTEKYLIRIGYLDKE